MNGHVKDLIEHLALLSHPEGGFYRETYRAAGSVPFEGGTRSWCTGIYFLLTAEHVSHLHRIRQDEMWHFYAGDGLTVHELLPDGSYQRTAIGTDFAEGQVPQHVVPAGHWFGATVDAPDGYALVGCTVSPGFDFQDFELAEREEMLRQFPQHEEIIRRLTVAR
ncbi:MAG: cupin domain-containing protein [Flavobacteriales bacterium]|nr:cupin domain-containing protein [Flavobacteriales bacterium]